MDQPYGYSVMWYLFFFFWTGGILFCKGSSWHRKATQWKLLCFLLYIVKPFTTSMCNTISVQVSSYSPPDRDYSLVALLLPPHHFLSGPLAYFLTRERLERVSWDYCSVLCVTWLPPTPEWLNQTFIAFLVGEEPLSGSSGQSIPNDRGFSTNSQSPLSCLESWVKNHHLKFWFPSSYSWVLCGSFALLGLPFPSSK